MYTTHQAKEAFRTGSPQMRLRATQEVLVNLDEWLPWLAAREFRGMTLSRREDDWLLVIRGERPRKPEVMFVGGANPEEVYLTAVYQLLFDLARWRADKYRTMRID